MVYTVFFFLKLNSRSLRSLWLRALGQRERSDRVLGRNDVFNTTRSSTALVLAVRPRPRAVTKKRCIFVGSVLKVFPGFCQK